MTARELSSIAPRLVWNDPALAADRHGSLAVAGETGTLRNRLLGEPAPAASCAAKTGTTDIASALSGYVGARYAFVLVQNGDPVDWTAAHAVQDRFVGALAALPAAP